MLQKLFGMKSESRQRLYEAFCHLPGWVKEPAIEAMCWIGRRHTLRLPSPPRLIWYATSRCNARCSHCFFGSFVNTADELALEEFSTVVRSLKVRLRSVNLTGGEPFLREELVELCGALSHYNRTDLITLPTNGLQPQHIEETTERILSTTKLRLNVQVSLDGSAGVHDAIRAVQGAFDRACQTVEKFKELKRRHENLNNISVLTTLTRRNQDCIPELIRFVRKELAVFHKFQFIRGSHTDVFNIDEEALSELDPAEPEKPEDIRGLTELITAEILAHDTSLLARRQVELLRRSAYILLNQKPVLTCLAGRIDGVIFANGDVSLCEMTRPFANLRQYNLDFLRLWNGTEAEEMRRRIRKCFCAHPCNLSTSMSFDAETLKRLSSPVGGSLFPLEDA